MIGRLLDSMIGMIAPGWAFRRAQYRTALQNNQQVLSLTSTEHGYEAGKRNRLSPQRKALVTENAINTSQIYNARAMAWDQYRNNPQARKISKTLEAKVIGKGMNPNSEATNADGSPNVEFREAVKRLWRDVSTQLDYRGRPGKGGQHLSQMSKTALRATIFSGSFLYQIHRLTVRQWRRSGNILPLSLQLIPSTRIDVSKNDESTFKGIELDEDDRRVAYWLFDRRTADGQLGSSGTSRRFPADNIYHVYLQDDIDQLDGVPWVVASLLKMRDRADYEYNELTAARMAACFVAGYRKSSASSSLGLPGSDANWDLTDSDGNAIDRIAPGMFLNLGTAGEFDVINPARPNVGLGEMLSHMIRTEAGGVSGVKGSTLSQDYRNSSFSSEKAADNDIWPEIEDIQCWFANNFMQPIYEEIVRTAVMVGYFDDLVDVNDFADRTNEYLMSNWQGPVARSINPKDDIKAAVDRIQSGTSSIQVEAARLGMDWRELVKDMREFLEFAAQQQIPDDMIRKMMGLDPEPQPVPKTEEEEEEEEESTDTVMEEDDDTILI